MPESTPSAMHTEQAAALHEFLRHEYATLEGLSQAIDAEHEALLANDPAALEAATQRKGEAATAHAAQQEQRLTWMRLQKLDPTTPLADLDALRLGDESLRALQRDLADLAQHCSERNRRNGGVIARLQDRTRGALDVLRREESSDLYSLSGAREHRSDSRSLGKA